MHTLGIPQSQASNAMIVVGACEVVSRVLTSYCGDYVKGKILYVYVAFAFALGVQNALGSLAYSYTHLVIYAAGKSSHGKTYKNIHIYDYTTSPYHEARFYPI